MWSKLMSMALAGTLLCATASQAQDWRRFPPDGRYYRPYQSRAYERAPAMDGRHVFVYQANGGGSFEDMGGGRWVENTINNRMFYRETARNPEYIELLDPGRQVYVRLYDTTSYQSSPETGGGGPLYDGYWQ
jgi:hypothetical protein